MKGLTTDTDRMSPSQLAAYQQGRDQRAGGLTIPKNAFMTPTPENLAWYWFSGWSAENSDIMDRVRERNS